jgi:hypothetical protein
VSIITSSAGGAQIFLHFFFLVDFMQRRISSQRRNAAEKGGLSISYSSVGRVTSPIGAMRIGGISGRQCRQSYLQELLTILNDATCRSPCSEFSFSTPALAVAPLASELTLPSDLVVLR